MMKYLSTATAKIIAEETRRPKKERKKRKKATLLFKKKPNKFSCRTVELSVTDVEKIRERIRKSVAEYRVKTRKSANDQHTTSNGRLFAFLTRVEQRKRLTYLEAM